MDIMFAFLLMGKQALEKLLLWKVQTFQMKLKGYLLINVIFLIYFLALFQEELNWYIVRLSLWLNMVDSMI